MSTTTNKQPKRLSDTHDVDAIYKQIKASLAQAYDRRPHTTTWALAGVMIVGALTVLASLI